RFVPISAECRVVACEGKFGAACLPSAPRMQACDYSSAQTRNWLEKMQKGCQHPAGKIPKQGGLAASDCGVCVQTGVCKRQAHSEDEEWRRNSQGLPDDSDYGQHGQPGNQKMPLGHGKQRAESPDIRWVDELKRGSSGNPAVDFHPKWHPRNCTPAIDATGPDRMAGKVIFVGPFSLEYGFGFAITELLVSVGRNALRRAMPYNCGGTEHQLQTRRLHPPAQINVITRGTKNRIEAAHCRKRLFSECHIAPGQMFCFYI